MNSKTFGLFAFAVFALVLVAGTASAAFTITPTTVSKNITTGIQSVSFSISINNDGAGGDYALTWDGSTSQGSLITPTLATSANNTNQSTSFSIESIPSDFVGTITGSLIAHSSLTDRTVSFTINVAPPKEIADCSALGMPSSATDVRVKKISFTNNGLSSGTTFGDDNSWYPFENIEAQIDVRNYGDYDASNVEVSWGLWDVKAGDWVIQPDNVKDFDLNHGDTKSVTVDFKIDNNMDLNLDELTDGKNYVFYAYLSDGTVDDSDSPDDGLSFCAYNSEQISINLDRDFVLLSNVDVPETVQCDSTFDISTTAWDIGSRDQDSVSIDLYDDFSGSMKLVDNFLVGNMNSFDNKDSVLSLQVPQNVSEGQYHILLQVLDENGDVYTDSNDDDSVYTIPFKILGGCTGSTSPVAITANLVSGGQAGQDLVVGATLINSGSSTATYTVSASGQGQWATSYTVNPSSLTLAAGQSGDATFTFKVSNDVSGEQTFYIEAVSGNQVERQQVSVMIQPAGFLSSITGSATGSTGAILAGLGVLVLILLAVVIVMAIRVARK
jgi:hypothetical protein